MPTFSYQALDMQGKPARGQLEAPDRPTALAAIAAQGLVPVDLHLPGQRSTVAAGSGVRRAGASLKSRHVESFVRELANLLAGGVPLGRALAVLRREASNPGAKAAWSHVHDEVMGGKSLADALEAYPRAFPPVTLAMVRAGEAGGFLDVVLAQIADFRERETELLGKVKAAMIYPIVLACLATVVVVFLLTFFIPRFTGIFEEFGANLPLLTQAIIVASHMIRDWGLLTAACVAGLVYGLRRAAASPGGRRFVERATLALPGVGQVTARFALIRFSRMLGTLLGANVPLVGALRVARQALGNQMLADAMSQAIEDVKQGGSLSRSLGNCPALFPASAIEMVAVAEESGRLDQELLRLAQRSEVELDRRLRMLVALAEPLLLMLMAGLIGTIVVGMLLPIFTLQELIQ